MNDRGTARVVGALFLLATVSGLVGLAIQQPLLDDPDYLTAMADSQAQVATGALLQLVMAIAVVGIAIAIHPVLRRYSERLSLSYVVARTIEAMIYVVGTVGLLTIASLGGAADPSGSGDLIGTVLVAQRDWAGHAVLDAAVFGVSAVILNLVLFRARLVPAWLSLWGLAGAVLYLSAGVMVLYGLEPLSPVQVVLQAPLGVQEIALALWLLFRGFARRWADANREVSPVAAAPTL